MKHDRRINFSNMLRAAAFTLYRDECARCSVTARSTSLEIHHLDENPTETGSHKLSNAIPLCPNHHAPIQRSTYLRQPDLEGDMRPESLRISGFDYLREGKYEKSYACYRLAAYFFENRQNRLSHAADCAIGCVAALRPIQGLEHADKLLRDAIKDAAKLVLWLREGHNVIWRAQFLRQLELALFDYREFALAAECCKHTRLLFSAAADSRCEYPEDIETMKANAARAHLLATDRIDDELLSDFAETNKTLEKYGDWRGYLTNLDVESATELTLHGPTTRARDIVEKALYHRDRISNPWVEGELRWREGILRLKQDRQKKKAKEALSDALRIFEENRIVPEPRRDRIERGPGEILRTLGIKDARLIDPRVAFPIGKKEVRRLICRIAGAPV